MNREHRHIRRDYMVYKRSVNNRSQLSMDERGYGSKWSVNNALRMLTNHRREHEELSMLAKGLLILLFSMGIVAWMSVIVLFFKRLFVQG